MEMKNLGVSVGIPTNFSLQELEFQNVSMLLLLKECITNGQIFILNKSTSRGMLTV